MDRRRKVRVGLAALAGLLTGGALGPLAPVASAETSLDVTAGYAGYHVPGRALPVQVTVTAERLVSGDLVVLAKDGKAPVAVLPVEVAGGSVKKFTVVVPGGVATANGSLEVELRTGGRALGRGKADVRPAEDSELVGLGPRLLEGRPLPGPAPLAVDTGVARFAALDAGLLAQAPASLDPLSTIGLASGEFAGLAPGARDGLLRWVAGGGHLLLDEPAGTPLEGLPAGWQPGPNGRSAPGAAGAGGEVRLTGDALAAGRFAGLVEPSSIGRSDFANFFSAESVANSLAGDAGLKLPKLSWLLGFLGLYILVVGPVTGIVLRRRRRPDLAWVVVPALAVVFTALAYVAGSNLRPGSGLAHGTILQTDPSGSVATSWVALTRRSAGTARVDLPGGWMVEGAMGGGDNGARFAQIGAAGGAGLGTPSVGLDSDGPQARLPLGAGEYGVFKASGPAAVEGRLEVAATSSGDGVASGTVRNGLPFTVDEVVVFAGYHRARVGRLAPGEQKDWSVGPADKVFDPSGSEAWMSNNGNFSFQPDGLVNFTLWQSSQGDIGTDGDPSASAMAVGWTDAWKPSFAVDGRTRQAPGRTAVIGRGPVTSGGKPTDLAVAADIVRGPSLNPFAAKGGGGVGLGNAEPTVVKMTLPAGFVPTVAKPLGPQVGRRPPVNGNGERHLALRTSMSLTDIAVWQDGAWRHLDVPFVFNDMIGLKRRFAIGGAGGKLVLEAPAPPPLAPTTTTVPPIMGQPLAPSTTVVGPSGGSPARDLPAAAPAMPVPVPTTVPVGSEIAVPGGGLVAGNNNAPVDIWLPDGIGADGVIFIRVVVDPSTFSPDAIFNLVEVVQ